MADRQEQHSTEQESEERWSTFDPRWEELEREEERMRVLHPATDEERARPLDFLMHIFCVGEDVESSIWEAAKEEIAQLRYAHGRLQQLERDRLVLDEDTRDALFAKATSWDNLGVPAGFEVYSYTLFLRRIGENNGMKITLTGRLDE